MKCEMLLVQKSGPFIIGIYSNSPEALAMTDEILTFRKKRLITLLTLNVTGFHLNENRRTLTISGTLSYRNEEVAWYFELP